MNEKYYNRQQRDLFMKTFGKDPHYFTDMLIFVVSGKWSLDILKFDDHLETLDPEYNNEKCTYKNRKDFSINKYLNIKYGSHIVDLIEDLMNQRFLKATYLPIEL